MSWEIFLGIAALSAFVLSFCKITQNNTRVMTEVKCSVDELRRVLEEQKGTLKNHELRIDNLEKKEK